MKDRFTDYKDYDLNITTITYLDRDSDKSCCISELDRYINDAIKVVINCKIKKKIILQ